MRIVNLASGSKANSTFVHYGNTKLLIDVGLNEKQLKQRLSEIGETLSDNFSVCITHEHVDHIRGLKSLAKKYDIDFYIKRELAESSYMSDIEFKEGRLHKIDSGKFNVGEFEVTAFDVSHDAIAPVGYIVNVFGSSAKVGFITDTGVASDQVKKCLENIKMVFIESNYDKKMLYDGKYPYIVKKRIDSEKGHLSNEQSLELAKFLYSHGTRCFVLSHLSQNNNTPELAYANYLDYFQSLGLNLNQDVFLRISFQDHNGNNFNLKEEFDGN